MASLTTPPGGEQMQDPGPDPVRGPPTASDAVADTVLQRTREAPRWLQAPKPPSGAQRRASPPQALTRRSPRPRPSLHRRARRLSAADTTEAPTVRALRKCMANTCGRMPRGGRKRWRRGSRRHGCEHRLLHHLRLARLLTALRSGGSTYADETATARRPCCRIRPYNFDQACSEAGRRGRVVSKAPPLVRSRF